MKQLTILSLKIAVVLIGVTVLALCMFWLPWLSNEAGEIAPEFAYLQFPVLIGLYLTAIPFFVALYQAFKLLNYIGVKSAFAEQSVNALKGIKYCAYAISGLYVAGSIILIALNALHPGIALIGFTITFASIVIAVFAAVLENLLKNAIEIKSENDLTV